MKTSLLLLGLGAIFVGCGHAAPVADAPPPLRPKPVKNDEPAKVAKTDCEPTEITSLPSAVPYRERSVPEAKNLADEGFKKLRQAESRATSPADREELITSAVDAFVTALKADPYNVHATYNLAAAYARIGRGQCAVNLLDRLVELRKLPSHTDDVEEKLDRLLGRAKFAGALDPDFRDLRDDNRFRDVVKKF